MVRPKFEIHVHVEIPFLSVVLYPAYRERTRHDFSWVPQELLSFFVFFSWANLCQCTDLSQAHRWKSGNVATESLIGRLFKNDSNEEIQADMGWSSFDDKKATSKVS